jgi:hypothetical protein
MFDCGNPSFQSASTALRSLLRAFKRHRKKQSLNRALLAVFYSPFALLITAVYMAFNIILLPFALLKVIVMKFMMMVKLKSKETIREFFFFLICGFPLLSMSTYTDVY